MTLEITGEDIKHQYSPLGIEVTAKIRKRWKEYRQTFGLEGDLYLRLRQEGMEVERILTKVGELRVTKRQILDE